MYQDGRRMTLPDKESVKAYWDNEPCGTGGIGHPEGSLEYYEAIAKNRDRLEPFIADYAQFWKWKGKKVLEVGCGTGSDLVRFAKAGAIVTGIDLSTRSAALAKHRLRVYGRRGDIFVGDAEELPFEGGEFSMAYSWGCLHHTPHTEKAIGEMHRVLEPGGRICVMLYHKRSLVGLQMYLLFGLLRGKPFRGLDDILANHHESPGTKAYTVGEVKQMFSAFRDVEVSIQTTIYDRRHRRDRYLPEWVGRIIPRGLGWHLIIRGEKPPEEMKMNEGAMDGH